jgi:NDP-4-keto-2,6-dideoxyhexose 3-C-methyltransferase
MYWKLDKCRICGNSDLVEVLDLGVQTLTGVFPRDKAERITAGPLKLVKCTGGEDTCGEDTCGLLQLGHSYELAEMYGENYGYRSGLNASMVKHLHGKVEDILRRVTLEKDALVIDIGSNDCTTLKAYPAKDCTLLGIDPTGSKFQEHYPAHVRLIPDFFSAAKVAELAGSKRATVITSLAMFYDLEDPIAFMRDIAAVLAKDGVWVFEQSYMPAMLEQNSYDTVCHEHLEYYTLKQIMFMAERAGLKVVDVELNDINGGSFSVVAASRDSKFQPSPNVGALLQREEALRLDTLSPYREFAMRVARHKEELLEFVDGAARSGRRVLGLGASTKGNVLLQYCKFTEGQIAKIGEVNTEKFGRFTPGTLLPIVPQDEVLAEKPDYLLVLPWHFRRFFETHPKFNGRKLVFPLPVLETIVA